MKKIPAIESVMTAAPITVAIDEPVRAAEDIMIDHDVRHLPVMEGGILVGVVSDRDIAFSTNNASSDLPDKLRVRDVCSLDVYSVAPGAPLDEVLVEMSERRLGSVVVEKGDQVVGVFTATDACRCLADYLRSQP